MTRSWRPTAPAARACPTCHAAGPIAPLLEEQGHVLHRCPACRTCFYADRSMPDYGLEQEVGFYQQLYLEQNGSIHHITRFLFQVEDEGIDSLLDVGCGFGFSVDMARNALGWRAVGIDPSHYGQAGAATLGIDIRKDYLTAETELGEPFALVVASEVIEHVPDPDGFVQLLRRWLQPGGTLIMTTPNADAIQPGASEAVLISILALGTHLFLFSAASLTLLLRRAGFAHVTVEGRHDNLVAYASDQPIRRRVDAEARHIEAYQSYLSHLVDRLPTETPLWTGAAGRLLQLQAGSAAPDRLHALFDRIAVAWRDRFGIDLHRLRLPPPWPEQEFAAADALADRKPFMWPIAAQQPFNLATVLFCRAQIEARRPGRLPEEVLRWARPAFVHAVHTARVLMAGTMIDLDLRQTAWRARMLVADCLAELAPELEIEILLGLAAPSPGALHEWQDPPASVLLRRLLPPFVAAVQADRFDVARRLEPWLRDLDAVAAAAGEEAGLLFYALFTLGVLRMVAENRAAEAGAVFTRLAEEAARRPGPDAARFHQIARDHVAMAAQWGRPPQDAPPSPPPAAPKPRRKRANPAGG